MAVAPEDIATRSGVPQSVVDFREDLTVLLLKAREDLDRFERKLKFSYEEAADLSGCSEQTIKNAINDGRLETGTSGWVTRGTLTKFLGYDPIVLLRDEVIELQRQSIDLSRKVEALFSKTISNYPDLSDSCAKIDPAA